MQALETLAITGLAVSAISTTVTKALVFKPLRDRFKYSEGDEFKPSLFMLVHCPYCLSHWVTFGLVLAISWNGIVGFILDSFSTIALANGWTWILLTSMTRMERSE